MMIPHKIISCLGTAYGVHARLETRFSHTENKGLFFGTLTLHEHVHNDKHVTQEYYGHLNEQSRCACIPVSRFVL